MLAAARTDPDPWHGVVAAMESAARLTAEERNTFLAGRDMSTLVAGLHTRFFAEFAGIVRRAQDAGQLRAGQLRADLLPEDLPPVMYMLLSTLRLVRDPAHDWRSYLALILDGLRPAAATEPPGLLPCPPEGGVSPCRGAVPR